MSMSMAADYAELGLAGNPFRSHSAFQNRNMVSAVEVFSRNLKALMAKSGGALSSNYKVATETGLGPTAVRRWINEEAAAQIDSVEKVAKAFKLRAADMLDPGLADRLERGEPPAVLEPAPPVVELAEWMRMAPMARAFVEDFCAAARAGLPAEDIRMLHSMLSRVRQATEASPPQLQSSSSGTPPPDQGTKSYSNVPGAAGQIARQQGLTAESRRIFKQEKGPDAGGTDNTAGVAPGHHPRRT
jgi:DNA-binding phage protein